MDPQYQSLDQIKDGYHWINRVKSMSASGEILEKEWAIGYIEKEHSSTTNELTFSVGFCSDKEDITITDSEKPHWFRIHLSDIGPIVTKPETYEKYSKEWLKQKIKERNLTVIPLRECTLCGTPLKYIVNGDDLWYDSNCHCVNYVEPPKWRTWDDFAKNFSIQDSDDQRDELLKHMGILD